MNPSRHSLQGIAFLLLLLLTTIALSQPMPGASGEKKRTPLFDGSQAYYFLYRLCDLGPRIPGSPAHTKARDNILGWFKLCGAAVREQAFTAELPRHPDGSGRFVKQKGVNLRAEFGPHRRQAALMICAGYDSRPWCDGNEVGKGIDAEVACVGANSNASGVAVLLELARIFAVEPPPIRVDLMLFDLELSGVAGAVEGWRQGSAFFAEHYAGSTPGAVLTLEQVGGIGPLFREEPLCLTKYPEWTTRVFMLGHEMEPEWFEVALGERLLGSHTYLAQHGFQTCALIDQMYPFAHTEQDIPQNCSPETLQAVGRLIERLIYDPPEDEAP